MRRILAACLCVLMLLGAAGCSQSAEENNALPVGVAGDYYIDLTELGMKLTIYLRISQDGSFLFSNTPAFETNKSSGTVQVSENEYLMVYSSVNGEDKSISDGLTSKFVLAEDGSLDFTACDRIYYGSASSTTTSADNPQAKLIALPIPEDYEAPSGESDFSIGVYFARDEAGDSCYLSFFDDASYIFLLSGGDTLFSEVGRYGVSTTQLALTPQDGQRVACEVVGPTELSVSVPVPGQSERVTLRFTKEDAAAPLAAAMSGTTEENQTAQLELYADGSVRVSAAGFTESGLLAPDSEKGAFKFYPDHPTDHTRGANQVTTVPAGGLSISNGKLVLSDFRLRTSESLTRSKCTFEQN